MTNIVQITPFMHVRDLDKALAFFTDVLDFKVTYRLHGYAYVDLDGAAIRILEDEHASVATRETRRFTYYIDVRDVDALYAALKPKLDAALPRDDIHPPTDKEYGQRELLVVVPDGQILAFGAPIKKD